MSVLAQPEEMAPALAVGVRLRWDERRQSWLLLGPEKVVMLDGVAAEILQRFDGKTRPSQIAAVLCQSYDESNSTIEFQINHLIDQLAAEGLLRR
jgi:pyrroloquinoline quinone biosynthesis protein D